MTKIAFKLISKTVSLPSYEGSEVMLRKITVAEQRSIQKQYKVTDKTDSSSEEAINATFAMIVACIVSRNFQDEDGNDIEVTLETLQQMPNEDVAFLLSEALGLKVPGQEKNE